MEEPVCKREGFVLALAALLCAPIAAQHKLTGGVTAADNAAAAEAPSGRIQIMKAATPAGAAFHEEAQSTSGIPPTELLPPGGGHRYPDDLTYQGGPTIGQATLHAIYVEDPPAGCSFANWAACWGNPENFLTNLGKSEFISLTDPYVGRFDNNRYVNGPDGAIEFPGTLVGHTFTDADMRAILHEFMTVFPADFPSGEDQIYHIFLPPGTDECFTAAKTTCYSPDNPNTFAYCGYHSSVTFADVGHAIYTVEPYANVGGCNVPPGTPNGSLIDSTSNTLSHETFESITDPEGNAWWNAYNLGSFGAEIGDECAFAIYLSSGGYYNPSVFPIHGMKYAVQPEYSNGQHACVTSNDD
jgi:hypothetical protein